MRSRSSSSSRNALPLPGLENGGTLNGLFVAGPGFPAVAVRLHGTPKRLEIRDPDSFLIAAWGWGDVIRLRPPSPPDMTGLCLADRRFPSQQLIVTDPTPVPDPPKRTSGIRSPAAPVRKRGKPRPTASGPGRRPRIAAPVRPRDPRPFHGLLAAAVVIVCGCLALSPLLMKPERLAALSPLISANAERAWGDALMIQIQTRGLLVCTGAPGLTALDRLTDRLAGGGAPPLTVDVIRSTVPQAFALPGHRVVVTSGLIGVMETADDLAAALALEQGRQLNRSATADVLRRNGVPALVALLLGRYDAAAVGLDAVTPGRPPPLAEQLETDRLTMTLLKNAGLRPRAVSVFMRTVRDSAGKNGGVSGALRTSYGQTHPVTDERLRLLNSAPRGGDIALDSAAWRAVKGICD